MEIVRGVRPLEIVMGHCFQPGTVAWQWWNVRWARDQDLGLADRSTIADQRQLLDDQAACDCHPAGVGVVDMQRLKADPDFIAKISERMHPGMIVILTDAPLHPDTRSGKDFVIMS